MAQAHAETRPVEIATLGERLSALRLCGATAVTAVRQSLAQHGQLSAVTVFAAGAGLEIIDGFKRVRAARALGWVTVSARMERSPRVRVPDRTAQGCRAMSDAAIE